MLSLWLRLDSEQIAAICRPLQVNGHSMIHKLLGGISMVAVFVFYGIGATFSVVVEHHHHADEHHDHSHLELVLDHHDDDSHHEPVNAPEEGQGDEEAPPSHSPHSHFVFVGADVPVNLQDHVCSNLSVHGRTFDVPLREDCPDGPSFDLEKPPQLV